MDIENAALKVEFKYSGEKRLVSLGELVSATVDFLEHYGEVNIVGSDFYGIIGDGGGEARFLRLLRATGYDNNPWQFFEELMGILETLNSENTHPVQINDVTLPYHLLLSLLAVLIPGDQFTQVKTVRRLEKLTNIRVPAEHRDKLQRVIERYPVRLSKHVIRQMRLSKSVAYQFMPFVDELNREGLVHTWVGQFHRGIVEQMYRNRAIFILHMSCPVYCRFCFRKHKECRNQRTPTQEHVKTALAYVKISPDIRELVLTGGDPFMNRPTLMYTVDGLMNIPHVRTIRIASRSISYHPHLFYTKNEFWLNFLKRKQLECEIKGKRIEVATHFIHPDEVSLESLDIITNLTQHGIAVYVQTPLLKDCNDRGPELAELYRKMRSAGAEMHYLYFPCSPIRGNRRYIVPISSGMGLASYLRAHLSDRAIPRFCTATKIGKMDWNTSGWAVETDKKDDRYIWIRTPYTQEYFSSFAPIMQIRKVARVNPEGTLDARFMADIGDDRLFWGSRIPQSTHALFPADQTLDGSSGNKAMDALKQLQTTVQEDQRFTQSIVTTGSKTLFRTHKTRVELDIDAGETEMSANLSYIRDNTEITDVVISGKRDVIRSFFHLKTLVKQLDMIPGINAVRLRSCAFNYAPGLYSHTVVSQLGKLNNLSITNPQRLEIETQFLHSSEITPEHKNLADRLRKMGITVYNNTPLLAFINDTDDEISTIAAGCRECGIEFHHLYIAGLPIQKEWIESHPVDISSIIDIATRLRQTESGRGIPRLIIRTSLGEVDFGLTSEITGDDDQGRLFIKLLPYTREYFTAMNSKFRLPSGVRLDDDGHPIVLVPGLKRTREFLVDSV